MKKIITIIFVIFITAGCTIVRIDTKSIDTTINVVLSKNNKLYNRIGKGYKYYVPKGVSYIDTDEYNDKLYSNGVYYYLYVDTVSYFYKRNITYKENKDAYYSRKIDINNKKGYLEINKVKDDKYHVDFLYNYAKIEALVPKSELNTVILNSTYILSTIKFNNNVVKLMLNDDYFINKEEKYDVFESKKQNDNSLDYVNGNDDK